MYKIFAEVANVCLTKNHELTIQEYIMSIILRGCFSVTRSSELAAAMIDNLLVVIEFKLLVFKNLT